MHKEAPPEAPAFAPKQEDKGKRGTSFLAHVGNFSGCKLRQSKY